MATINRNRHSGFSLIEVLIASTILLMLVMMLGMLFQSTSQAWSTGQSRADRFMLVRSFFGALQRDASAAVDESRIPQSVRSLLGGKQNFSSGTLQFYTLSGSGFKGDNPNNPARCAPAFVTYSFTSRKVTRLLGNGSVESVGPYSVVGSSTKIGSIDSLSYQPHYLNAAGGVSSGGTGIPDFLSVFATFSAAAGSGTKDLNVGIEARSAGPDGVWDTEDDITTAAKE